jgi:hypothetical protein
MRLAIVALLFLSACGATIQRSYSRDELQAKIGRRFPIERRRSVFFVRLANPDVILPGGDRIALGVDLEAGAVVPAWRGRGAVEGVLEYRPADGGFYLRDPTVRTLELDGVPPEWVARARDLTETALIIVLAERPLFVLDEEHHQRERAHLKRVWVENDRLMMEIEL